MKAVLGLALFITICIIADIVVGEMVHFFGALQLQSGQLYFENYIRLNQFPKIG